MISNKERMAAPNSARSYYETSRNVKEINNTIGTIKYRNNFADRQGAEPLAPLKKKL